MKEQLNKTYEKLPINDRIFFKFPLIDHNITKKEIIILEEL